MREGNRKEDIFKKKNNSELQRRDAKNITESVLSKRMRSEILYVPRERLLTQWSYG